MNNFTHFDRYSASKEQQYFFRLVSDCSSWRKWRGFYRRDNLCDVRFVETIGWFPFMGMPVTSYIGNIYILMSVYWWRNNVTPGNYCTKLYSQWRFSSHDMPFRTKLQIDWYDSIFQNTNRQTKWIWLRSTSLLYCRRSEKTRYFKKRVWQKQIARGEDCNINTVTGPREKFLGEQFLQCSQYVSLRTALRLKEHG